MDARLTGLLLAALAAPAAAFDHSHQAWDGLLRRHVVLLDAGKVSRLSYAGIARERATLSDYLRGLSRVADEEFTRWSEPQQVAFLINAYNAHTVEKILQRYPDIRSIWDFGKVFGNPFKDAFFTLLGRRMSLDEIEHGTLRKRYREPSRCRRSSTGSRRTSSRANATSPDSRGSCPTIRASSSWSPRAGRRSLSSTTIGR
jgi:hypothetical protein